MVSRAGTAVIIKMLFCACGIYGSFFTWSFLQERIATEKYLVDGIEQRFRFIFILNTMQALCAVLVGCVTHAISVFFLTKHKPTPPSSPIAPVHRTFPLSRFATIGLTATFASPFGYAAMQRISYPMVITVKMCKMVPIIAVGALWHRRRYSTAKYLDCLLITMGVLGFTVFGDDGGADGGGAASSALGVALVFVNLFLDGYTNSTQDEVVRLNKYSGTAMMVFTNMAIMSWSVVALVAFEFLPHNPVTKPEFFAAINFIAQQPSALQDVIVMGALNAMGQFFIFQAISLFGSLTVTAMTVTRKVGSVLISIFTHNHTVTIEQWWSLVAIFAGIILDTYINIEEKKKKDHDAFLKKQEAAHANDPPEHHYHKHKRHHLHEVQRPAHVQHR